MMHFLCSSGGYSHLERRCSVTIGAESSIDRAVSITLARKCPPGAPSVS